MAPPTLEELMAHADSAEALNKASYAAATQVLNTAELLEHILHQLPMQDLLLDQRVSKTWKACIDRSPTLQRALFFRPSAGDTSITKVHKQDVLAYFAELYITRPSVSSMNGTPTIDTILEHTSLNPLLASGSDSWWIAKWLVYGQDEGRKEGSWRRMLVFQPPLESMGIIPEGFAQRCDTLIAERSRSKPWESQENLSARALNKALTQAMRDYLRSWSLD